MFLGSLRSFFGGRCATGRRVCSVAEGALGRLLVGSLFLALGFTAGCGGGSSSSSGGSSSNSGTITVKISPSSASLAAGGTQQFTATVSNDSSNQGVTWALSQNGTACSPGCGTVSVATTASGSPTTYTAPGQAISATLTATSVADTNVSASVTISVAGGISVLVSPSSASVSLGGTYNFTASVANDTSNKGVTWQLLQNGTDCTPGCGSLSSTSTASGNPTTYTAPTTAPNSPLVTLKATSVAASSATSYATITIQGSNAVTVSPTYVNVPVKGTQLFTATVTGGSGSQDVTWQLTQNGKTCSPGCGSLSSSSGSTGNTTTYTAPDSPMTVTLTATSSSNSNESGTATIVVQPITVSVAPSFSNAYPSQTITYVATVNNDAAKKGVTWSLTENGKDCSPTCGSISPTSTGGGVQTTYTAPSSVKSAVTITVVATSVSDTKVTGTATIDLYPPIAVSLSPTKASSAVNSRTSFTATVTNDPTQAGVKWALTQNDKDCTPGCGSVSPTSTSGDVSSTTYFAPSSVPGTNTVTLTATSGVDIHSTATATITITSSTTVKKLSGSYAFLFNGYDSGGAVAVAGSFTTDGAGNVTGGIEDINRSSGVETSQSFTGAYTVGADNQGTLTLIGSSDGTPLGTFRFALNDAGDRAQFIEFDSSGTRGSGTFLKQAVGSFSPATVLGKYAFGASGADAAGSRLSLAGAFRADGHGKITGGALDTNDGGAVAAELPLSGSYRLSSAGRGTLTMAAPGGVLRWAFYVVSPKEVFLVSIGDRTAQPLSSGKAVAQLPAGSGGFSAASLDGTSVISLAGTGGDGKSARIAAGLVTFDAAGGLDFRIDQNDGGKIRALTGSGSYSVAPDGRVKMNLPALGQPLVAYLVARNEGMLVGAGTGAAAGSLDPRAPGGFSDSSISGAYVLGTVAAPSSASSFEWGRVAEAGSGKLAGKAGSVSAAGVRQALAGFSDRYAVSPDGRGLLGSGNSVVYLISPERAIVADMSPGQANGTISSLEK